MTIPSRPAPAPPGSRGFNAAAGANASIDQLRLLQLQQPQQFQQQQQQQQNGGVQKLTIKLPPPPPAGRNNYNSFNNINSSNNTNASTITRKFPQANVRYAPATSWDGSPFDATTRAVKKVPPPRPPPPKISANNSKKSNAPAPPQSINILNNIFSRKKSTKAPAPSRTGRLTPAGVYGTSSGSYGTTASSASFSTSSTTAATSQYNSTANFNMWPTSNNTASSLTAVTTTTTVSTQDAQLISFDSPPSSPTFTQKSNSDCVSVDSFSSDSNFSSPHNGSVSQPESGFEDDFSAARSRSTTSPLDPWETVDAFVTDSNSLYDSSSGGVGGNAASSIGTAPVRNLNAINTRMQSSNDNLLCNGKSLLPPAPSLTMPTIIKPKISQKPKAPKPPALGARDQLNSNIFNAVKLQTPPSPPMPMCAPPPPPHSGATVSLLDVISGKGDALHLGDAYEAYSHEESGPAYGIALYDFEGLEDGDLSFRENDKIYLLEQVSDEWYRGRTRSGCEGIFPVNYVEIKLPLANNISTHMQKTTTSSTSNSSSTNITTTNTNSFEHPKVKCLYNFAAEVAGDLGLQENDLVTILYKINEDWLFGEVHGRQGQFPSNFLEYVPDNLTLA